MTMATSLSIRLFATLKDRAGGAKICVDMPDPATVEALLAKIAADYPELAPALPTCLVSVNRAFASDDAPLKSGDEIALFPPVSGGNHSPTHFAVTEESLDIMSIHQAIRRPKPWVLPRRWSGNRTDRPPRAVGRAWFAKWSPGRRSSSLVRLARPTNQTAGQRVSRRWPRAARSG